MRFQTTTFAFALALTLTATDANAQNGARRALPDGPVDGGQSAVALQEMPIPSFLLATTTDDEKGMSLAEGFNPSERGTAAPACSSGTAVFNWTIQDGCSDGQGIYLRFFDVTNDLVWPDASHVYVQGSGKVVKYKLTVKRGAKICYGADPNPQDGGYWGLGVDGDYSCASCCYTVPNQGNIAKSTRLTC